MKESPMMVKSVLQWVWKMADIAATDFIRHLHIHQIFLVKWFPSFEKTIRCEYHCQEYHNSAAIQRYDCYVMWWWDMGSADSSTEHCTSQALGSPVTMHMTAMTMLPALLQLSRVMVATIVLRPNLIDLGLLLGCPPRQGSIGAGEVLCGDVMLLQEAA